MSSQTSSDFWATYFREFRCAHCGSDAGYPSRPRNFVEKYFAPLLLLRKVRCGDCYQRSYRPVTVHLRKRHAPPVINHELAVTSLEATLRSEPAKETPEPAPKRARIA